MQDSEGGLALVAFKATYRTRPYIKKGRARRTPPVPGIRYERELFEGGAELIAGVDEVGMGAWAGPVAVGAVVLDPKRRIYKVRDSKLVDPARREWLAGRVRELCLDFGIGLSWPGEIDEFGLSEALRRAAARALASLTIKPDACLLDGHWNFLGEGTKVVVRGDCESISIASASIIAKVARDSLMRDIAAMYPAYGFHLNKGYPSPLHKWALAALGPSPVHRLLFAPVRRLLESGTPGRLLPASASTI